MSSPPRAVVLTPLTSGAERLQALRLSVLGAAASLDRKLPWASDHDPWSVLVREVMLQQTPVSRVVGPWRNFMHRFPTPTACADATQSDVLRQWAGLGYHRRARNLHLCARQLRDQSGGVVPNNVTELLTLPGVGSYTARAVATFAFGQAVGVLDTNVGRVLARYVENRRLVLSEAQLLADRLVDQSRPALFNQALLDLGAQFCRATPKCEQCPVKADCRWQLEGGNDPASESAGVSRPQSSFYGSSRESRGRLLRQLRDSAVTHARALKIIDPNDPERAIRILQGLIDDGLVSRSRNQVALADS